MSENLFFLPQDKDTCIESMSIGKMFNARFASVRSSDSREHGQRCQDYVGFHIRDKGIAFIVCDGVSQSFYGDFASRFLGARLLDWIGKQTPDTINPKSILKDLYRFLGDIRMEATGEIQSHAVPDDAPGLLLDVLEEKRRRGSETTYVCGRIDLPDRTFPQGRAIFSWMGNTRLRLGNGDEWGMMVSERADENKGRWSTSKGPIGGKLKVIAQALLKDGDYLFRRILVYTDGVSRLDKLPTRPSDEELDRLIKEAVNSSDSDDSSFLEIEILP